MRLSRSTAILLLFSLLLVQALAYEEDNPFERSKVKKQWRAKYRRKSKRPPPTQPKPIIAALSPPGRGKRRRMTQEEILAAERGPYYSAYNPPEMPICVHSPPNQTRRVRGEPGQLRKYFVSDNQDNPCPCGAGSPPDFSNCACIAPTKSSYVTVVQKLADYLDWNATFRADFDNAMAELQEHEVVTATCLRTTEDFLSFADQILKTPPYQDGNSRNVYNLISLFYLVVDQPSLLKNQSPVIPGTTQDGRTQQQLTWLSEWLRAYSMAWGDYLDTRESVSCVETFKDDDWFCWYDFVVPDEGFENFNHYFARDLIDINYTRPVNCSDESHAVVFPADSTYVASYNISNTSTIDTGEPNEMVSAKGVVWSIQELLFLSDFRDEFANGVFAHSFLSTYNYHRWHTPISGKIVERRVISGQFYLNVTVVNYTGVGNIPDALDDAGYQFVMQRGLIVIEADDPDIGYVAAIPMGMAQVSSIFYTKELGENVTKGDELGTFYFGGSDFVVVFQEKADFHVMATPNVQYYVRQLYGWIGPPPDPNPECAASPHNESSSSV